MRMERKVKLDHAGSCGPLTALSHSKSGVQEVWGGNGGADCMYITKRSPWLQSGEWIEEGSE